MKLGFELLRLLQPILLAALIGIAIVIRCHRKFDGMFMFAS